MSTIKLTLVAAALCGGLLALAPMSGASAAPMGSIGKAAAIDSRTPVYYYGYHHHRHCWWHHGRRSAVGDNVTSRPPRLDIAAAFCFSIGDDRRNPLAKTRLKCAVVGTSKCADRHLSRGIWPKFDDCAAKMDFEPRGNRPRLRCRLSVPRSSNCTRLSQDGRSSGTFAKLTHLPDPFVPLAVITFVGLGLWNLSGRPLSRIQNCALLAASASSSPK